MFRPPGGAPFAAPALGMPLWTQVTSPDGRMYYVNMQTGETSWTLPPGGVAVPAILPQPAAPATVFTPAPAVVAETVEEKEKPVSQTPIEGTDYKMVHTNKGRRYFFHIPTKRSHWTVPEDIKDIVALLDQMEEEEKVQEQEREEQEREAKRRRIEEDKKLIEEDQHEVYDGIYGKDKYTLFKVMLHDLNVSPFSTWEKEFPLMSREDRFDSLATLKEKKTAFDQYCKQRLAADKDRIVKSAKAPRNDFMTMMESLGNALTSKSRFTDLIRLCERDSRYLAISSPRERESMFKEYIATLAARESADTMPTAERENVFLAMLKEKRTQLTYDSSWRESKSLFENDPRYLVIRSSSHREDLFYEYLRTLDPEREERRRREREEQSLRDREDAVRRQQHSRMREAESERSALVHEEGVRLLTSLFVQYVKSHETRLADVIDELSRDARWKDCGLSDEGRENVFRRHLSDLFEKRKNAFARMLDEYMGPYINLRWEDILPNVRDDPRFVQLGANRDADAPRVFEEYIQEKRIRAIAAFKELLKENKYVYYAASVETKATAIDNAAIHEALKSDNRYLVMDALPEERQRLIDDEIEHIQRKGPDRPLGQKLEK